jgi:tRNA A-37 threonylcarbamoyl transferase component Bud32
MQIGQPISEITIYPAGQRTGGFVCSGCQLVREVAGVRQIYFADWNQQKIVLKIFRRGLLGRRHVLREWNNLLKLRTLQILRPEPLFFGKTESGQWAMATEYIVNSRDVFDYYQSLTDKPAKAKVLMSVIGQLAHLHIQGVLQKDLHLGNFLEADNRLYILDPAQIRFYSQPIAVNTGLAQLALLCTNWPADDETPLESFIRKYFAVRGLVLRPWQTQKILEMIRTCRKRNIERMLPKTLRNSKRYFTISTKTYRGVFAKSLCEPRQAAELPLQIDLLMSRGRILKRGNTCFVSLVEINGQPVVIKRYNHKGLWHSIKQTFKGSRAKRCWLHSHRLNWLNIPTAAGLGFIEKRRGPLLYCSYILNAWIEGPKLDQFLQLVAVDEERQTAVLRQIDSLLELMDRYRITHGDLKRPNILITENGPMLIDLDSMKVHRLGLLYRHCRNKDMKRFDKH